MTTMTRRPLPISLLAVLLCLFGPNHAFVTNPLSGTRSKHSLTFRPAASSTTTTTTPATERDGLVQNLLQKARQAGQVGADAPLEQQEELTLLARQLADLSDPLPARTTLEGRHDLVYSASKGGSSGKLGPFVGKVTQTFGGEGVFYNRVFLGPLEIELRADCTVKNDSTNGVKFRETTVKLLGQTVVQKELNGGGVWKYLFLGKVQDADGTTKLVRIIETPSLFIIEQPL